jgi:TP901-1 family phage major tail protein
MAAQAGKDVLIKMNTAAAPTVYTTVAGIRTASISFNSSTIDITNQGSTGRWRELLNKSGLRSCAVSGSGVFLDAATDETVRKHYFDDTTPGCELVVPDFGTVAGTFRITSLEYSGDHDGEATFSISLESAGALTFTAIPAPPPG